MLIKCPECGTEVSDRAFECPKCGARMKEEMPKVKCKECGEELAADEVVCHKCGCPTQIESQVEKSNGRINIKKILIILIALLALVGVLFTVKSSKEKARVKAEEAKRLEELKKYERSLSTITEILLDTATRAEEAGGLIHDVWYNTIYDKSDPKTDKYTRGHSDFNDSLQALFNSDEFISDLIYIMESQTTVKNTMKELKNPPEEYEEAYLALKDLYEAFFELTNLVTDPSGNLQTFTSDFNEADSAVSKYYETMCIYIE